jgi:hypothetical protein
VANEEILSVFKWDGAYFKELRAWEGCDGCDFFDRDLCPPENCNNQVFQEIPVEEYNVLV